ncbi:MAG TPA: choice-of-anchor tandem repeat GloVer-containing protein [Terriglobales bacterium]|nr:choice-of-anchor tandem repeat GloVer-containing protein [Terriglobales bacterium]
MPHSSSRKILRFLSLFFAMLAFAFACRSEAVAQTGRLIHEFQHGNATDGASPQASLTLAADSTLYGTTAYGGTNLCEDEYGNFFYCGTVFALEPPSGNRADWRERVIYNFGGSQDSGYFPSNAALILDAKGNLYGTTEWGVSQQCGQPPYYGWPCGTVFQLVPPTHQGGAWRYNLIYTFQPNSSDGFAPDAGLVFDTQGNLYGTTTEGGQPNGYGVGTVYELSPPKVQGDPWAETVLYSFQGSPDGAWPAANLVGDGKGNFFSTTVQGGTGNCSRGCGTIFELSPSQGEGELWTETVLYSFQGGNDGWSPNGVVFGNDGSLYGTTQLGGNGSACSDGGASCGTFFRLQPPVGKGMPWTETVLHSFQGGTDGAFPFGNPVSDSQGRLYGTTFEGGSQQQDCSPQGCGTIFALIPHEGSWEEKIIYRFDFNHAGRDPQSGLTLGGNDELFGTTSTGGNCGLLSLCGTVFEVNK